MVIFEPYVGTHIAPPRTPYGYFSSFALSDIVSQQIEKEDGVLVLTDDNFEEAITQNEHLLVEFYVRCPLSGYPWWEVDVVY